MSSVQESLLFRINIQNTGLTAQGIDKIVSSLKNLSEIRFGGTSGTIFKDIANDAKTAGTAIDGFTGKIKELGSVASQAASQIKPLGTETKNLSTTLKSAETAVGSFISKAGEMVSQIKSVGTAFESAGAGVSTFAAKSKTVTDALGASSTIFNTLNTTIKELQGSIERLITVEEKLYTATNQSATAAEKLSGSFRTAGSGVSQFAADTNKATVATERATSSQQEYNTVLGMSRGQLKQTSQEMINYVSRATGMFISVVGLTQAVQESVGMQEALADQQDKLAESTAELNALKAAGLEGTKEYARAEAQVAKDTRGLTVIQRNANYAWSDQIYFVSLLAVELTSMLIPAYKRLKLGQEAAGKSGMSFFQTMKAGFSDFGAAFKTGFSGASKNVEQFGETVMKSQSPTDKFLVSLEDAGVRVSRTGGEFVKTATKTEQLGKALGAFGKTALRAQVELLPLTAFLTAYEFNLGGVRDMTNAAGKAAGDYLQVLKPFGEVLVGVAGKLGMTGESADKVAQHFENAAIGFSHMSTLWNNTVADLENSTNQLERNVGTAFEKVGQSTAKLQDDFWNQVHLMQQTWDDFWAAIGRQDYSAVVDIIGKTFGSIPEIIGTAFSDLGSVFGELSNSITQFATDMADKISKGFTGSVLPVLMKFGSDAQKFFEETWNNIVGISSEVGKRIIAGLGTLITPVKAWVTTNIVEPINAFVNEIKVEGKAIWDKIVGTAGNILSTVESWIMTNIVNPINNSIPDNVKVGAAKIWDSIVGTGGSILSTVQSWLATNIISPINNLYTTITGVADKIWSAISGNPDILSTVTAWAQNIAKTAWEGIIGFFNDPVGAISKGLGFGGTANAQTSTDTSKQKQQPQEPAGVTTNSQLTGKALDADKVLNPGKYQTYTGQQSGTPTRQSGYTNQGKFYQIADTQGGIRSNNGITTNQTGGIIDMTKASKEDIQNFFAQKNGNIQKQSLPLGPTAQAQLKASAATASAQSMSPKQQQMTDMTKTFAQKAQGMDEYKGMFDPKEPKKFTDQMFHMIEAFSKIIPLEKMTIGNMTALNSLYRDTESGLKKDIDSVTAYTYALTDADFQQDVMTQGMVEQYKKGLDLKTSILSNTGVIKVYNQQLADSQFISDNVVSGMQEQQIAFKDQQAAIYKTQGHLIAYGLELKSGRLESMAFTTGMQSQEKEFYNLVESSQVAQGSYVKLGEQLKEGYIQNAAFNKGLAEGRLEIANQAVAVSESTGHLNAYYEAIKSGAAQTLALKQGQLEANQSFVENYLAVFKAQGALETYQDALSRGVPQWTAYQKAIVDTKMAISQNVEAVASAMGTYQALSESFLSLSDNSQRVGKAFFEAKVSFAQWVEEAKASNMALDGTLVAIDEFSKKAGVEFPRSMKFSTESAKEFYGVLTGIPSVIDSVVEGMYQGGQSLVSKIADGMKDGKKGLKDAVNEISDMLGADMTSELKAALKIGASEKIVADQLETFGQAIAVGFQNMDMRSIGEMANRMKNAVTEEFSKLPDTAQTAVKPIMDKINELLSAPPDPKNIQATKQWLASYQEEVKALQTIADPTYQSLNTVATIDASKAISSFHALNTELEKASTAFKNVQSSKLGGFGGSDIASLNELNKSGYKDPTGQNVALKSLQQNAAQEQTANKQQTQGGQQQQQDPAAFQAAWTKAVQNVAGLINMLQSQVVAAIGTMATAAQSVIPTAFTDGFNKATQNAAGTLNMLAQQAQGVFTAIATAVLQPIPEAFTQGFNTATQNAAGVMNTLTANVVAQLGTIVTAVQSTIPVAFTDGFNTATQNAAGVMNALVANTLAQIGSIATAVQSVIPVAFTDGFTRATQNAAGMLNALAVQAGKVFEAIVKATALVAVAMTQNFNKAAQNAAGSLNALAQNATKNMAAITTAVNNTATKINDAFFKAANAALGYISSLQTRSASAFTVMAGNAVKVADAVRSIGTAASSAASQVDSLASRLKSIPATVHTTIDVGLSGPGAKYLQKGTTGQIYFERGGTRMFAEGGNDFSAQKRAIVGETGDEVVRRIGLRTGSMREEKVTSMRTLSNLGMHEPELLQVIPTSGYYARRFSKITGMKNPLMFAEGTTGTKYSTEDVTTSPGQGFGVSSGANPNTGLGPITVSSDGKVHLNDDQSITLTEWNKKSDNSRTFDAESDDVGFKSLPKGTFLEEDYSISKDPDAKHGQQYSYYVNNTTFRSGNNAGQPSPYYDTGSGSGSGGGGTGSGTGTGTGGSGATTIPVHSGGPDPNVGYNSDLHVTLKNGKKMTLQQWNEQSESKRKANMGNLKTIPQGYVLFENGMVGKDTGSPVIDTGSGSGGDTGSGGGTDTGGTGTGTGGSGSGETDDQDDNVDPGSGTGTGGSGSGSGSGSGGTTTGQPRSDMTPKEATASGGFTEGYIKPGGWGANSDPNTWKVTTMKDDPKQYKVVDSTGRNVATNFNSQEAAQDYIDRHKNGGTGVDNGGPTGSHDGSGTGTGTGTGTGSGTGTGTGTGSGTGSTTPTQVVTSGNVRIEQYPNGQKIYIDGKLVLDSTSGGGAGTGTGTGTGTGSGSGGGTGGTTTVTGKQPTAYLAGLAGMSYNHNTSTHPVSTGVGSTAGTGTTTTPASGSGGSGGNTGGSNNNFNYQANGKYYRYQNGTVDTNMSAQEISAAESRMGFSFPKASSSTVPAGSTGSNGLPGSNGTTTGGTVVTGTNGTPGTSGGTTQTQTNNGMTQTQTGGGNQFQYAINGHKLTIQNGQITENTLTPAEYAQADAFYYRTTGKHLPASGTGTGGTGGGNTGGTGSGTGTGTTPSGEVRDTIFKSMALTGGYNPNINFDIPSGNQRDSVNSMIDNQADPLFKEFTDSINSPAGGGSSGTPGTPGTPGGGNGTPGQFDWEHFISRLLQRFFGRMKNEMGIEIVNQVNEQGFWAITNDQLMKNFKRF